MRLAPSHECLHRDWFFSAPFTTQFTVDVAHRDQGLAGAEPNLLSVSWDSAVGEYFACSELES